jgi:prepilin-type N-terminal cleavage/methylation domain-containing protein
LTSGYTLIELMMVVVIIGIVGALAAPIMPRITASARLNAATDTIRKQLMTAKVRAISNPYVHCGVHVGISGRTTLLYFDNGTVNGRYDAGADTLYMPLTPLPQGVSFDTGGSLVDNTFLFRGDGSVRNGGVIVLKHQFGTRRLISVSAGTGRIKVH